jgi:glutamate-1-semialdehyde 2,1-aminomutase
LVTYGKTLGGGFPVGVVCGKKHWMTRFDLDRPANICFARGTFKEHPVVMGAMSAFLDQIETPEIQAIYQGLDERWNARAAKFNQAMQDHDIPLHATNMSSVWTLSYTQPSRYNWMLQYYLRIQGLALSWVGTGRLIFSLNYSETDFDEVVQRFVLAATQMKHDGWWWHSPEMSNKSIRRSILKETLFR